MKKHSYLDNWYYSKTCLKRPLKNSKLVFKTEYRLKQVKSIAECSKRSILQYFRPSLSYILSLTPLFCLFFEGPLKTGFYCIHSWLPLDGFRRLTTCSEERSLGLGGRVLDTRLRGCGVESQRRRVLCP